MGYKLNIAIAYLFDDQDFTRYIEDKILNDKEAKFKDQKKNDGDDEDGTVEVHTQRELRLVFQVMSSGIIEQILIGEKHLDDVELDEDQDFEMTDV